MEKSFQVSRDKGLAIFKNLKICRWASGEAMHNFVENPLR